VNAEIYLRNEQQSTPSYDGVTQVVQDHKSHCVVSCGMSHDVTSVTASHVTDFNTVFNGDVIFDTSYVSNNVLSTVGKDDTTSRDTTSQDTTSRDTTSLDTMSRDTTSRDTTSRDATSRVNLVTIGKRETTTPEESIVYRDSRPSSLAARHTSNDVMSHHRPLKRARGESGVLSAMTSSATPIDGSSLDLGRCRPTHHEGVTTGTKTGCTQEAVNAAKYMTLRNKSNR